MKLEAIRCPYCNEKMGEWVIGIAHFRCSNRFCRKEFTVSSQVEQVIDKMDVMCYKVEVQV